MWTYALFDVSCKYLDEWQPLSCWQSRKQATEMKLWAKIFRYRTNLLWWSQNSLIQTIEMGGGHSASNRATIGSKYLFSNFICNWVKEIETCNANWIGDSIPPVMPLVIVAILLASSKASVVSESTLWSLFQFFGLVQSKLRKEKNGTTGQQMNRPPVMLEISFPW